jgi:putative ABC transport system ATP-binding protein
LHQPRLLVCDEPTAALDGDSGRLVMNLIREMAVEPGRAVVVVTHDTRLYGYADLFALMSDGRIARIARKEEMTSTSASEPHP